MRFASRYFEGGPRVLVVAPDGPRTRIIEAFDEQFPYDVSQASTAAAAIEALDDSVCCVVATASLPDGSGRELATDVDQCPPVILLVEEVDNDHVVAMAEQGSTALPMAALENLQAVVETHAADSLEQWEQAHQLDALEQLLETINLAAFVKDLDARYLLLTETEEMPNTDIAIGKRDDELHDDRFDIGKAWYAHDRKVLATGEPVVQQVERYDDDDGNRFFNEISVVPWRDDEGEMIGLVGLREFVLDREVRRIERERKIRRLEQFVRNVSHDLKSPLQVAHGRVELGRDGDDEALDKVAETLESMEELIRDIEKLARMEHSETASLSVFRFCDYVRSIWSVVGGDGATLQIDVPDDTIISAEKAEFRPLIENLLKNAIEHGPDDVSITIGPCNDGFYVEDDGPGIPVERRSKVFEEGVTSTAGGHGVGLAIVSDIVESHDWDLSLTEGRDGGARFTIENCLMGSEPAYERVSADPIDLRNCADVGDPETEGDCWYDEEDDELHVTSDGADIYGDENEFHYVYATVQGPARITGHVADVEPKNPYSKGGFMIRDSLAEDATHGFIGQTPDYGAELLWRTENGARTVSQHLIEDRDDYEWFRLERVGSQVTCWVSQDGDEWQLVDQRSGAFSDAVHVGVAGCSVIPHNPGTAVFEDVVVETLDVRR